MVMVNITSKLFTLEINVRRLDKIHYELYSDVNNLLPITGGRQGSDFTQGLFSTTGTNLLPPL